MNRLAHILPTLSEDEAPVRVFVSLDYTPNEARPGAFVRGMGSALDLYGCHLWSHYFEAAKAVEAQDVRRLERSALRSDWDKIGRDFRTAIRRVETSGALREWLKTYRSGDR